MKKALLLLFIILLFSCDSNVYIDDGIDSPIWRVGNVYFKTANEAVGYVMSTTGSSTRALTKTDDVNRTIVLTRDVLAGESVDELGSDYSKYVSDDAIRGSITIPEGFTGSLTIDFGGHRYDFANTNEAFFVVEGGDNIYIYNGTSVIFNKASHDPYAISVNTETVTIDTHLIDDRRVNNKLFLVGEKGHLSVDNVSSIDDGKTLSGEIAVVTDGTSGAQLDINASDITITNIYTKYKDGDGNISDTIDDSITIDESARSTININSGTVKIRDINKETDYYYNSATGDHPFDKAYINIYGVAVDTTVEAAHKIYDTIEKVVENSEGTPNYKVLHDLVHHPRAEATCVKEGNIEYWECTVSVCGCYFSDKNCESKITNKDSVIISINPSAHSLEHTDAKAATCTEDGNVEYWHCSRCKKYFSDSRAATGINAEEITITHLGHKWDEGWQTDEEYHWHVCENGCGETSGKGTHTEVLRYNKSYHWYECSVCGKHLSGNEAHAFSEDGTYCTKCGYVVEKEDTDSGFDVKPVYKDPTGEIESSYDSTLNKWTFTLKPTNQDSLPTGWEWYVDGTAVDGANASTFEFIPLKNESYVIFCLFWNDNGAGSSEVNIYKN